MIWRAGSLVRATARPVHSGRTQVVVQTDVTDDRGRRFLAEGSVRVTSTARTVPNTPYRMTPNMLTAVAVGGVWVVVGLRTGVWSPGLLYSVGGITFYFAILYSVSTLFGVLTRSTLVAIE